MKAIFDSDNNKLIIDDMDINFVENNTFDYKTKFNTKLKIINDVNKAKLFETQTNSSTKSDAKNFFQSRIVLN